MARIVRVLRKVGVVVFLAALCAVMAARQPEFLSMDNIKDVLVQISGIAIAAVGMTLVILTAGIDLSVGSVLALSGCAGSLAGLRCAEFGPAWMGVSVGFAAAIATGAVCGLLNGLMVTKIPLTPFIATLGVMGVARGMAYYISHSSPVQVTAGMRAIALARPLGIPFPIILMLAIYAIGWLALRHTRFGRNVYAIGGNEESARLSGIRIHTTKILVYTLTGALAAVSGLIVAGRLAWMMPQEGDGFELDVIAAVVIGGTSLAGGQGNVLGTLLGALIMGVVRNGLNLAAVDYNVQKVVIGGIIIAAVAVDVLARRLGRAGNK
ncbi:MAG TPA: ABC transporter permease [Candidatus Hydrogenedentes bacterium]|nr:ABC transporter permease [Candidatus Hydrogenedentota bacterium]HOT49387.1 ABC transporter permease [Candidatus Hydrogenedentota bacterium]HOV72840.1 ABC transporter permease [Candidatus Hydrogenedentota bacterium]HPC16377.1 ABC transporter permease [Candidatus Hydrogenedentota bacterium]HRT20310.1 ABC transporter permease [Candidatus Hydrogenedentota bacterium]